MNPDEEELEDEENPDQGFEASELDDNEFLTGRVCPS